MTHQHFGTLIDGKAMADTLLQACAESVTRFRAQTGQDPGLAVVLVGHNPASQFYVEAKKKACQQVGIVSYDYRLAESDTPDTLNALIDHLNADPDVHGILVQLPLPPGFDEQAVIERINPLKDVDGFHPMNLGRVFQGLEGFRSCTPYGVLTLLQRSQVPLAGAHVVIVGRSNIVGKPLAALLVQKGVDATVTLAHSKTTHLADLTRTADVLVAAIGVPERITADMVKPGAVVIDVGINRVEDQRSKKKYRIVGDVDFDAVRPVCQAITPVPGGVGPMTIAMLLGNTMTSAQRHHGG